MSSQHHAGRDRWVGLAFLAPNILGFLVFTLFPLLFSLAMAFTNWDLRLHNVFRRETLRFAGVDNFGRLFADPQFWQFLRNTLFLMMAIPFGVAGSLGAALLLSRDLRGGGARSHRRLMLGAAAAGVLFVVAIIAMRMAGMGASATTLMGGGLVCAVLLAGTVGGVTVYRTLFYLPNFTAGVATFILWRKMYNPQNGPINNGLRPVLEQFGGAVNRLPADLVQAGAWVCATLMLLLVAHAGWRLWRDWRDGEAGLFALLAGGGLLLLPALLAARWASLPAAGWAVTGSAVVLAAALSADALFRRRPFACAASRGVDIIALRCGVAMVLAFALLGMGNVCHRLPALAAAGLTPPEWLTQPAWAKPAIMIMSLWAAIGSGNMLLYLAGLSNIPPELLEAADIDGASASQRFWHVTWPQLAPVTFFIVVMSLIGGLQGGFEMARTMTQGGPAGATTTLSYYVYTEGFATGRLGYASAVAWTLFLLVLTVTLVNWKFGSRATND